MTAPDFTDLAKVTVTGALGEGLPPVPLAGYVTFTPDVAEVAHVPSSAIVRTRPIRAYLNGEGAFTALLPATDAEDLTPTGWAYRVSFEGVEGAEAKAPFMVSLPADSGPWTLTALHPAPAAPPPPPGE